MAGASVALDEAAPDALAVAPDDLGTLAADGGPQPAGDDARQVDAVALAKSLLPTVGVLAIEYNLPILEVDRYKLDALVLFFFQNHV